MIQETLFVNIDRMGLEEITLGNMMAVQWSGGQLNGSAAGEIMVDDAALSALDSKLWRQQGGVVTQDGYVFTEMIKRGILWPRKKIWMKFLIFAPTLKPFSAVGPFSSAALSWRES